MTAIKYTIYDIKQMNKAAGYHFFDRATLDFFASKILSPPHVGDGGIYFVTSEQFTRSNGVSDLRRYTVRQFNHENGRIDTVGVFNMMSLDEAKDEAKRLAKG